MRGFALAYPDAAVVQQLLDDYPLPWGHFVRLLEKVKEPEQHLWHLRGDLPTVEELEAELDSRSTPGEGRGKL